MLVEKTAGTYGSLNQPTDAHGSTRPNLRHPERSREPALSEVEWGSAVLQARLGNVFDNILIQVEVKVCRAYGARTMLGNRCPSPSGLG